MQSQCLDTYVTLFFKLQFPHKSGEWKLSDEKVDILLIKPDLVEGPSSITVLVPTFSWFSWWFVESLRSSIACFGPQSCILPGQSYCNGHSWIGGRTKPFLWLRLFANFFSVGIGGPRLPAQSYTP